MDKLIADHASPDPASVTTSQFYISAGGGTSADLQPAETR